ncbi:MAG: amidohydrolase family protein [Candidatus Nanohaloarchaea archaeon]|nr:amidohydrolase family protein [Candidatus Nanohaloarchaea archaeon]
MKYIDAHVHVGYDKDGVSTSIRDVEELIAEGLIDGAVVFAFNEKDGIEQGNERIAGVAAEHENIAGLFRVDPAIHDPGDLRGLDGFHGFKMHPHSQDFRMREVYDYLQVIGDTEKPVLIHSGEWIERGHPEGVIDAAEDNPGTDIVAAHNLKGYYYSAPDEYVDKVQRLDNLHIEVSTMCTPMMLEVLVQDLGADRILYGTDYPYGHPLPMNKNFELADIPPEKKEKAAWKNAERLFF